MDSLCPIVEMGIQDILVGQIGISNTSVMCMANNYFTNKLNTFNEFRPYGQDIGVSTQTSKL